MRFGRLIVPALVFLLILPALALAADYVSVVGGGNKEINFRQGPGVGSRIVYKAKRFYPVRVIGHRGGWIKTIDFQGDVAWVLEKLTTGKNNCAVVKVKRANIRQSPTTKAKILFTAGLGASFRKIRKSGNWWLVEHADGDRGWISRKLLWPN